MQYNINININTNINIIMQILLHLPESTAIKLKHAIPARKRSAFICELLEKSLPNLEDELYELALRANESDKNNIDEMNIFSNANLDGLDNNEVFDLEKLEAVCQK